MLFSNIKDGDTYRYLVNGKWEKSSSKDLIEVYNPSNGRILAKLQSLSKSDIDDVLKNSKVSQKKWKNTPVNERADILMRAADLIVQNAELLSDLLSKEISKPKHLGMHEVMRTADLIRSTAEEGLRLHGEYLDGNAFYHSAKKKKALVDREPLGVVLAICPFNYPVNLSFSKVAPALISGNSVVLKPSTQGALSVLHVSDLFSQAGLPQGVLNVVTGKSSSIGDYLCSHKDVNMISFTGSTSVGKHIASISGMKPLMMELGGKDGVIVLDDADLDLAVKECVQGVYSYSGQRCTAVKRIILVDKIANVFVKKFVEETKKLKTGDPDEDVVVSHLINRDAADYIKSLIDDAVKNKAKLILDGKRKYNLYYPVILDNITSKCRIFYEEQFGPVACIIRVKDEKEAVSVLNDSSYGLQASVFTNNLDKAFSIASQLDVGAVQINGKSDRGPDNFPFPCIKDSGIGVQGIKYSIESMTRLKSIVLNFK